MLGFLALADRHLFQQPLGTPPTPDELIDQALKGLDKKYTLYHYSIPVSHLLVGPAGVWILLPYYQRGTITYKTAAGAKKAATPI